MNNPKDIIGVVVYGSEDTNNELNRQGGGGYEHVCELINADVPDIEMVDVIDKNIKENDHVKSDFIDGVVVGLQSLLNSSATASTSARTKSIKKKLFVLSDGCEEDVAGEEDLDVVAGQVETSGVEVYVIGCGWEPKAVEGSTKGHKLGGTYDGKDDEMQKNTGKDNKRKEQEAYKCRHMLQNFCRNTKGHLFYSVDDFMSALRTNKIREKTFTTKCRVHLELTQFFKIPVWIYLKTKVNSLPSLKKGYAPKGTTKNVDNDEDDEDEPSTHSNAKINHVKDVQLTREYYVVDDVNMTPVDTLEKTKAYKFGKQLVPISELDMSILSINFEKMLCLLGVVNIDNIKRQFYLSTCECVMPEPNNTYAHKGFMSLVNACRNLRCALLCKYIARRNSTPRLVCIHPDFNDYERLIYDANNNNARVHTSSLSSSPSFSSPETSSCCMYLYYLPFYEDLRFLSFPSFSENITKEQAQAIDKLISSKSLIISSPFSSTSLPYSSKKRFSSSIATPSHVHGLSLESLSPSHTPGSTDRGDQNFNAFSLSSGVSTAPSSTYVPSPLSRHRPIQLSVSSSSAPSVPPHFVELLKPEDTYNPTIHRFRELLIRKATEHTSDKRRRDSTLLHSEDEHIKKEEDEEKSKRMSHLSHLNSYVNELYNVYNIKNNDYETGLQKEKEKEKQLSSTLSNVFPVCTAEEAKKKKNKGKFILRKLMKEKESLMNDKSKTASKTSKKKPHSAKDIRVDSQGEKNDEEAMSNDEKIKQEEEEEAEEEKEEKEEKEKDKRKLGGKKGKESKNVKEKEEQEEDERKEKEEEEKRKKKLEQKYAKLRVRSVDPINDFNKMLSIEDSASLTDRAINEMCDVITEYIKHTDFSGANMYTEKATACLQILREECVKKNKGKKYNDLYKRIKNEAKDSDSMYMKKFKQFYEYINKKGITYIEGEGEPSQKGKGYESDESETKEEKKAKQKSSGDEDYMDLLDIIE